MSVNQMKRIQLLLLLLLSANAFAQWKQLDIPNGGRYDDLFFINDNVGWAAGGPSGTIYKTTDGGETWNFKFLSPKYLRSIEFINDSIGFCGSLDSSFYKSTDGGETWTDIAQTITPRPHGICGLSAPTKDVIYGCGIWSSPAFIIKSTDRGATWTSIDMSAYANSLVEIHFINADTGFVSGMSNPITKGGVILYTKNGGLTWEIKYQTNRAQDYVWKIQSPNGKNYYASIESFPTSGNVRMVQSVDSGKTWATKIVKTKYTYVQTIGFIDTLRGWTGGDNVLYETKDGGTTWNSITLGTSYNRFFRTNDSTAFLSGTHLYKYNKDSISTSIGNIKSDDIHSLTISPNPFTSSLKIDVNIKNKTNCKLLLVNNEGKTIQTIYDGVLHPNKYSYQLDTQKIPAELYYVILKTNEGLMYKVALKI